MSAPDLATTTLVGIGDVGGFHAEINPLGAELWRLTDRDGRDLLWNGDPAFWTGRAPVLFPIVGALKGDGYRWRGEAYSLSKHGFARRKPWVLTAQEATSATFRLEDDAATRAAWPFAFRLELTFTVTARALAMTVRLENTGDGVMPFSFGFHPALRWPFAGGDKTGYRLRFDREEPEDIARIDGAGLIDRRERSPVRGRELALDDALFVDDALIFTGLASKGLDFIAPGGEALRIDFAGFPDLGVWMKPGADYLCIEPWLGHADPADASGELLAKPGIATLQPGEHWRATMTIAAGERA